MLLARHVVAVLAFLGAGELAAQGAATRAPAPPRPQAAPEAARASEEGGDDAPSRLTTARIERVPPPVPSDAGRWTRAAQAPASGARSGIPVTEDEPGSELTVYLMTIGVGDAVWQRFGHNALWIRDARANTDIAYNWGMFDFDQPNFLGRFLTGETRYWMEGFDAFALAGHYSRNENRSVWAQELNLTPAQRLAVRDFVKWNEREENRYYRYDYYRDNCSTRVRDAIDRVLGGALQRQLGARATGTTYRSHTRRLTAGDAAVYTGTQLALGRPTDRPISAWEEGFLPTRLMSHVRDVRVPGPDGGVVSLVRSERTLFAAAREPEPLAVPSYWVGYAVAGLVVLAAFVLASRAARRVRAASAATAVLAVAWTFLLGVLGTLTALGIAFTRHRAYMGPNENLALASPLLLVLLVLVLLAVGPRRPETRARTARLAEVAALAVAALAIVGGIVQALPRVGQGSAELALLVVPAQVGLWIALRQLRAGDAGRAAAAAALPARRAA